VPGVQLVLGDRPGDGAGGGALRRHGQRGRAAVEQAAEDAGEGQHVVDLVRLVAAAAGKLGAFTGTYALTALLPAIGFGKTSAIVAGVSLAGLLVTVTLLPEPKGISLEELTETRVGHMNLALARRRASAPR
jgi:hypothetical protein